MKETFSLKKNPGLMALLLLLALLNTPIAFGQEEAPRPKEYLGIQTGITFGPYVRFDGSSIINNNSGIRLFGEFKREIGKNWFYGVSICGMVPISGRLLPIAKNVSFSAYYRVRLVRDRLFLLPGLGLGSNFVFIENEPLEVVPTTSLNLTMLWRVSNKIYLEFSPLGFFATRYNVPFTALNDAFRYIYKQNTYAITYFFYFPIGVKVAL